MRIFVYQLKLNERYQDPAAFDQAVQDVFKKHAEFLQKGIREKKIMIVGRTEAELKDNFGLVVFKAEGEDEARRFMQSDPVVQGGVMSARVYPFILHMVTDEAKQYNVWPS